MATISFAGPENTWLATRWVFFGFLEHVLAEVDTESVRDVLKEAMAYENLDFPTLDAPIAREVARALVRVAQKVGTGASKVSVEGRILDDSSQEQFRRKVKELEGIVIATFPDASTP